MRGRCRIDFRVYEGPELKPRSFGGFLFVGLKPYANPKKQLQRQKQIPIRLRSGQALRDDNKKSKEQ